ncbi:MAG: 16S rRNA (cytidine(1402)-2'-O)-methyltransferase [Puniceicoccales bacterium]|nr:16S rRNA (cytidine(1402)-2'-O)-methyltransferase [Puniceicoccales bacterium]
MSGDGSGKFPPGLYVVATPIGNLGDLSQRARDVLAGCDLLACEDTRVTGKLLVHFGISAKMLSYREENERSVAIGLADRVGAGLAVALACDAGTPAVSDPGFRAVRECRRRGLPVYAVPGPSASTTALSASGLPSDRFLFLGFPPSRSRARRKLLCEWKNFTGTVIFYESCHRIVPFVVETQEELGPDRTAAVGRELTKLHESWHVGPLATVAGTLAQERPRGEYVLLIAPEGFSL